MARERWNRPFPLRVILVIVGIAVGLIGLSAWSVEAESAGRSLVITADASGAQVHEVDQDTGEETVVFSGAAEEARAFVAERIESRNYAIPGLLVIGGCAVFLMGVWPRVRGHR